MLARVHDTTRAQIGQRLRSERQRLGLAQPAIAAALGIAKLSLLGYEHGRTPLRVEQLAPIDQLGFDVYFIATGRALPRP